MDDTTKPEPPDCKACKGTGKIRKSAACAKCSGTGKFTGRVKS